MAIGDDAIAAGMDVVAGSAAANTLDTEINKSRDYIAQRTSAVTPVLKGGTGSTTAAAARTALGIPAILGPDVTVSGGIPTYSPALTIAVGAPTQPYHASTKAYVDASVPTLPTSPTFTDLAVTSSIYNSGMFAVVSSYIAVYRNGDGRIGFSPSTRRAKKDISAWTADKQAILALQVVTFHYRAAMFDADDPLRDDPPLEVGMIAEDVAALGLEWLVWRDAEGLPAGIHYERLALALLPVIQDHETRLAALEGN